MSLEGGSGHFPEDALVSPPVAVHPLRDVRGLACDLLENLDGIGAWAVLPPPLIRIFRRVANLLDRLADNLLYAFLSKVRPRGDLSAQEYLVPLDHHLDRESGLRVAIDISVQEALAYVVRHLVGVPQGHPFAGLQHLVIFSSSQQKPSETRFFACLCPCVGIFPFASVFCKSARFPVVFRQSTARGHIRLRLCPSPFSPSPPALLSVPSGQSGKMWR